MVWFSLGGCRRTSCAPNPLWWGWRQGTEKNSGHSRPQHPQFAKDSMLSSPCPKLPTTTTKKKSQQPNTHFHCILPLSTIREYWSKTQQRDGSTLSQSYRDKHSKYLTGVVHRQSRPPDMRYYSTKERVTIWRALLKTRSQ